MEMKVKHPVDQTHPKFFPYLAASPAPGAEQSWPQPVPSKQSETLGESQDIVLEIGKYTNKV